VCSRAALDGCGKSRLPPGFVPRTVQSVASRYTDQAISVPARMEPKSVLFMSFPHFQENKAPFLYKREISLILSIKQIRIRGEEMRSWHSFRKYNMNDKLRLFFAFERECTTVKSN